LAEADSLTGTTIRHEEISGAVIGTIVSGRARLPRHRAAVGQG
jgi:hypothetical protein